MKFSEIIEGLQKGHVYQRESWYPFSRYIAAHVPQSISAGTVEKMTSISDEAKQLVDFLGADKINHGIDFHDQVLEFSEQVARQASATAYTPTWEDIFADDWKEWHRPEDEQ